MIRALALAGLVCSSLLGTACAQKGLYAWGSYENDVLDLYKSPGSERVFAENLRTMILEAQKAGVKTPPGVAAEYGFLQYQAGQPAEAIRYFDLERTNWPESATLMTKLIERLEARQGTGAPSAGADGGDEGGTSP